MESYFDMTICAILGGMAFFTDADRGIEEFFETRSD